MNINDEFRGRWERVWEGVRGRSGFDSILFITTSGRQLPRDNQSLINPERKLWCAHGCPAGREMIITSKHEEREEKKKRARLVLQAGGCVAAPPAPPYASSLSVPSAGLRGSFSFAGDEHPPRYAHPLLFPNRERPNPSFSYLAMDLISSVYTCLKVSFFFVYLFVWKNYWVYTPSYMCTPPCPFTWLVRLRPRSRRYNWGVSREPSCKAALISSCCFWPNTWFIAQP